MNNKCKECLCFDCNENCKKCDNCLNNITNCEKNDYGWINPNED